MFPKIDSAYRLLGNEDFVTKVGDKVVEQSGTRPLSWLIGGYRHLTNSEKPITKIDDLQGLKIRVPPCCRPAGSLQVLGHRTPSPGMVRDLQRPAAGSHRRPGKTRIPSTATRNSGKSRSTSPNCTYMLWVGPMLFSEGWYAKLDPDTKALVKKAAKEAAQYEWKWAAEQDDIAKKQCIDKGMVLSELTDEPVWQEKARSIWPQFEEQVGGKAMIEEALSLMK